MENSSEKSTDVSSGVVVFTFKRNGQIGKQEELS